MNSLLSIRQYINEASASGGDLSPDDFTMDDEDSKSSTDDKTSTEDDDKGTSKTDGDADSGDGSGKDLDPSDFTMDDDSESDDGDDTEDDPDSTNSDSNDDNSSSGDSATEQEDNPVSTRILTISEVDRSISERNLLNNFFYLKSLLESMGDKVKRLQTIMSVDDFVILNRKYTDLTENITRYITYKFTSTSLEDNTLSFTFFSKEISDLMDKMTLENINQRQNL